MKHCLVVDDSAVIRKVAKRILEGLAMRVTEAEDAEQGLASCRGEMPDAIMLDSSMPDMDGYGFLKELRAMPDGKRPRVLLATMENDVGVVARAMHAGADEYLMKPFDRQMITEKMQDLGVIEASAS